MTVSSRLFTPLAAVFLAACAASPAPRPVAETLPFVTSSGLVIGTLSYQYVESGSAADAPWVVHFERVDTPARQQYELVVDVDPRQRSGVFTGALPAGVYAFREAASDNRSFSAGTMKMPFEVQAGEVRDAGHYALNPVLTRQ